MAKLERKIALVAGASSGIGEATATRLQLLRRFAPAGIVDTGIRKNLQLDALTASPQPRPENLGHGET